MDFGFHNNSIDFCKKIPELNYLVKFFENIDTKLVDRIKNSMPVVGSDYEKQTNFILQQYTQIYLFLLMFTKKIYFLLGFDIFTG